MNSRSQRIVCLSAEAADWFWRLGAWEQVAGVTAFFEAPPGAAEKPRISGFSTAQVDRICGLKPDLVITFSDVQANIAAQLTRRGLTVLCTNQRTLAETEQTLALLARVAGREHESEPLLRDFREKTAPVTHRSRPRVYFEEWNDPPVSGIGWVSELIERAGGQDVFRSLSQKPSASERVVSPQDILAADPEVILASWCGKHMDPEAIASRPGWQGVTAVRTRKIFAIPGAEILQPGYRLIEGFTRIRTILGNG